MRDRETAVMDSICPKMRLRQPIFAENALNRMRSDVSSLHHPHTGIGRNAIMATIAHSKRQEPSPPRGAFS
jgi:hypothetical protein